MHKHLHLRIVSQYDLMLDLKINVGFCACISWLSDFALYLEGSVSCQPAGRRPFWSPASRLVGDLKVSCQPVTGILIRKWCLHGIVTLSYNLLYFNI